MCPLGYHHNGFVATRALGHAHGLRLHTHTHTYIYVCVCNPLPLFYEKPPTFVEFFTPPYLDTIHHNPANN